MNELIPLQEPPGFNQFWEAYPLKVAKFPAKRAYNLALRTVTLRQLLTAVNSQKAHREQLKKQNQFVPSWPYPATYLNQQRWLDIPTLTHQRIGPTLQEVREYSHEKFPMENDRGRWAASFHIHWQTKGWRTKDGKTLDWKPAFTEQVAKWRRSAQNVEHSTQVSNATSANL